MQVGNDFNSDLLIILRKYWKKHHFKSPGDAARLWGKMRD